MSANRMSARTGWLLAMLAAVAMMAYALYTQYVLELFPCPLCIFQRIAVVAFIIVAFLAWVHNPRQTGQRVYGLLAVLAGATGVSIAARHVWLQNLPADQVPTCGAGLEFMMDTLPLLSVIREVLTASGECADISWQLFGLSMPAWVAISLVVLTVWAFLCGFVLRPKHAK